MEKGIFSVLFVLMLIILLAGSSIATETTVNVNTLANRGVEVYVLKTSLDPTIEGSNLIKEISGDSGSTGIVSFSFSSTEEEITLSVIIKKDNVKEEINGKTVHKFENRKTNAPIEVYVIPGQTEESQEIVETTEVVEETTEVIEEPTEETSQDNSGITGGVISEETAPKNGLLSNITYIIIAGVFIALLIAFFVLKMTVLKRPKKENIKVTKYSEFQEQLKEKNEEKEEFGDVEKDSEYLKDAEEKLKSAREELEKIKSKHTRIAEAERKFEQAREELEKARKEAG